MEIKKVCVIGMGTMGSQIGIVCAGAAGYRDVFEGPHEKGKDGSRNDPNFTVPDQHRDGYLGSGL